MPKVRPEHAIPHDLPQTLPVMALRKGVLLPGSHGRYLVGRQRSLSAVRSAGDLLIVAAQREAVSNPAPSDLLSTAVLARVVEREEAPDGRSERVLLQGLGRVELTGFPQTHPHLEARFSRVDAAWPQSADADGLLAALKDEASESEELLGGAAVLSTILRLPEHTLPDGIASALGGGEDWLREVLSTHDVVTRAERVLEQLVRVREARDAQRSIKERVQTSTRDQQREFFLRQQLAAIQEELGQGGGDDDLARLRERLEAVDLPDEAREVVDRELKRLERLGNTSPERSVAIDWLEWIADLPWGVHSALDVDLRALEEALDRSHFGLDDVKRQVLEHLAVRKLAGSGRADVLLLVGPPGVGKTSIGEAIANASGRKLVRVALGGVRDEAELRGHRRTYIGARPGRLVEGIRRAGTADPVILLDEVDKLGRGVFGDPAAGLLEVLDPEQNHAFVDRYLELAFDLSKVLFVATANDLSSVPGPLRDRMQIIDIAGYTPAEKVRIARDHLLDTVAQNAGLTADDVSISDEALRALIDGWTREPGVRELQRVLGKVFRAAAVRRARDGAKDVLVVDVDDLTEIVGRRRFFEEPPETSDRPGLATGLAWTPVGGSVLYVEASTFPGTGRLVLTGQLGDVMKESARAALTYVLANSERLGLPPETVADLDDIHVHVPAGAVPKDGPSAGVTMFTALASLLSGRPVRTDTAMTGEATLRGRVLPVGGIKSKVLAAHRQGLKRVILPRRNAVDLDEVPKHALDDLEIVLVDSMDEVLAHVLTDAPRNSAVAAA